MFTRHLTSLIEKASTKYKAIALVGPRQSGKTTLAKACFPDHQYISLEDPDHKLRASEDPKGFLRAIPGNCILDEVQNSPHIFSYLQGILDSEKDTRQFVLTGSNSFRLNAKISQSLAGRIRIFSVLPLTYSEIPLHKQPSQLYPALWSGSYPRIYNEGLDPNIWCADYYKTYVQKDVRELSSVADLGQFDKFMRILAGRTGQLTQFSSMASEVGVSQPTIVRWMGIVESSFLAYRLAPHFRNFNKRVIKTPKVYFYDTGLLCYLLRIRSPDQLEFHPLRGAIFENFVVSEIQKSYFAKALEPNTYFWRDQHGHEIDVTIDLSNILYPVEIKMGSTLSTDWLRQLRWLNQLQSYDTGSVIYGGDDSFDFHNYKIVPWSQIHKLPFLQ